MPEYVPCHYRKKKFANRAYMAPILRKFALLLRKISWSNQILISLHCNETKSNYIMQSTLSELGYGERTKTVIFSVFYIKVHHLYDNYQSYKKFKESRKVLDSSPTPFLRFFLRLSTVYFVISRVCGKCSLTVSDS